MLMKVETHNHPTAIAPYAGAATGAGGEIRDEAATGRGAKPKAGMSGFTVSNLHIPELKQAWEEKPGKPDRIVSALEIMLDGPIGAASYNNEFGRPALTGYFRSYEQNDVSSGIVRGYHKPIMLAGGFGTIRPQHVEKNRIPVGAKLIVLGGPAMLIGLGGGAASSMSSGDGDADLDFASVQRDNPEMQRRCQEVINHCWAMDKDNPIISIHDVGAGGLSNALPELIHDSKRGAIFQLRDVPSDEIGMSPLEIWCNESQERYVLAISSASLTLFEQLCRRERAPFAVVGEANDSGNLLVEDKFFHNQVIDMPLQVLLGKPPRLQKNIKRSSVSNISFDSSGIDIETVIERVLQLPSVADKSFLINIGDRSVSGLVVRDQMVGRWQTPVADCAITASGFDAYVGEAMAIGERSPIAVTNAPASGRLALAEAILNICSARILKLDDISLSANWMAASGQLDEDEKLYDTVQAVSKMAIELGIAIPVGKDSLSMNTVWQEAEESLQVSSPLSVNITAFARVADIRRTLTPELKTDENTCLLRVNLNNNRQRLGGSALAQVFNKSSTDTPDLDNVKVLKSCFEAIQLLNECSYIKAYHDCSDGGVFVSLCEMAFTSRIGLDINLSGKADSAISELFNEEPAVVIQINVSDKTAIMQTFMNAGLGSEYINEIARINNSKQININAQGQIIYSSDMLTLHRIWSATSYHMQKLRDNPTCAEQEYSRLHDKDDPGLSIKTSFDPLELNFAPVVITDNKPKIAILREQGVNGQIEMAAAFDISGFEASDVHMSDLLEGTQSLEGFSGLVACGGFSYGDVLGAGGGWAKTILFNESLRDQFSRFFERNDSFALGVCNGCQMLAQLHELIPGAENWPEFIQNESEQFESRLVMVEVMDSPSLFLDGMSGSILPVVVAHGEGRANFKNKQSQEESLGILRYVDNYGDATMKFPSNPNGSKSGLTGFCSEDGRVSIMMPHPERVFQSRQYSWKPEEWQHEYSPWIKMFINARRWIDQ